MTRPEQVKAYPVSSVSIMRSASFRRGVDEYRARKRPDFDGEETDWNYERGRQFAAICRLPIMTGRRINPIALSIFDRNII